MTPDERGEFDDLMYDAGYDAAGKPRPSHEIGERVVTMLRDAAYQAHRPWAGYVLDDLVRAAALGRWKQWAKQRDVVSVRTDDGTALPVTVSKPALMSIRRQDAEGASYFQPTMWDDMTRDELLQVIARAQNSIQTSRDTVVTARRVLALLDQVEGAKTPADAARVLGTDVASFLSEPGVAA